MYYILCVLAGIILDRALTYFVSIKGTLELDLSDEDKETYRFIVKDIDELKKHRSVFFKIDKKS